MMTQADEGGAEQPIRIVSANFPPEARRALDDLLRDEPGFLLVGSLDIDFDTPEGNLRLLETFARLQGDDGELLLFVLYSLERRKLPNIFGHLMQEYPDVRLLIFTKDEMVVSAYWMGLHEIVLPSVRDSSPSHALRLGITYLARVNPQDVSHAVPYPADDDAN